MKSLHKFLILMLGTFPMLLGGQTASAGDFSITFSTGHLFGHYHGYPGYYYAPRVYHYYGRPYHYYNFHYFKPYGYYHHKPHWKRHHWKKHHWKRGHHGFHGRHHGWHKPRHRVGRW